MTFWYRTNEYKPSDSGQYLVYQETTGYRLICYCDHFTDNTFKFMDSDTDEYLDGITHFAQSPPIPKECDHLWSIDLNGRHAPQCMKCMKNKTSIEQV